MQKITFLGYGKDETRLIDELEKRNCIVKWSNQKISSIDFEEFGTDARVDSEVSSKRWIARLRDGLDLFS